MASSARSAIAIVSIGDMGVGIAKLLIAKGFSVVTNINGRSEHTATRAREAGIQLVDLDESLVSQAAVVLSVVPPRDAISTAQRIIDALPASTMAAEPSAEPLYYVDLNAVSPSSTVHIASLFTRARAPVSFIDGCIIGAPPQPLSSPDWGTNGTPSSSGTAPARGGGNNDDADAQFGWSVPSIPTSGPHTVASILGIGPRLSSVLGESHISPDLGAASGLKMCFASLSKGLTALAVESFTTAHRLGVLPHLRAELATRMPLIAKQVDGAVVTMPPKAYRWVREMEEISDTHREEGGFVDEAMFKGAAGVYRVVANNTVLGGGEDWEAEAGDYCRRLGSCGCRGTGEDDE
ncbi:hypothetical protein DL546_001554 [Coniochaeta pulveracea]|uniref:Phosphogluconate dehydrogenase NAD-binding putative C-terminal domain-containing protein n=1 Tax=Coniochaeta pulveracea TaxID=177199 RepID=A0A420XYT5_9PEZI|nr:hypothetical protein DL546_001554 [Coniochaeta pulveracea]